MTGILAGLYKIAYAFWNTLLNTGVTLIKMPLNEAGGGSLWGTAAECYDKIVLCTVPLATIFFMISIYRAVISEPPEQQLRKFLQDAIRFAIILYISANMMHILQIIAQFSSGLTNALAVDDLGKSLTDSKYEDSLIGSIIENFKFKPDVTIFQFGSYIEQFLDKLCEFFVLLLGGVVSVFIMTASGIVVISVGFQRIIKPLVILPFSAIVLGISSCSGEGERMMWQFGKSFLGFCISGAFMIIAIRLGGDLCAKYVAGPAFSLEESFDGTVNAFVAIVQTDMTAIVITGLLKSMDGVVAKVFG